MNRGAKRSAMLKSRVKDLLMMCAKQVTKVEDVQDGLLRGWSLSLTVEITAPEDISLLLDGGPDLRECKFGNTAVSWFLHSWEVQEDRSSGFLFFKGYEKKMFIHL